MESEDKPQIESFYSLIIDKGYVFCVGRESVQLIDHSTGNKYHCYMSDIIAHIKSICVESDDDNTDNDNNKVDNEIQH